MRLVLLLGAICAIWLAILIWAEWRQNEREDCYRQGSQDCPQWTWVERNVERLLEEFGRRL